MVRRFSRLLGLLYLLLAILNLVRHGILSLAWIAWMLLAAGAPSLVYTPVEKDGKTKQELAFSRRNQVGGAVSILGGGLLIFLLLFHNCNPFSDIIGDYAELSRLPGRLAVRRLLPGATRQRSQ